ncbi:hypothetical protein BDW74DRAFT_171585 [Aspergillus multicolor]|uniref:uncharacterized protein n=1 Tax=Aspergillus multicolor TaxID=41759 RepID=UPI003CCD0B6E
MQDLEAKDTLDPECSSNSSSHSTIKPGIGPRPSCFKSTLHEISFVLLATLAMATNSLVTGALIIVTASIGADLDMSQAQITWISAATTLTAGAFQLPLGQLTDLLGRKPLLILGSAGFSASALLLGFAKNAFWMDIIAGLLGLFSALVVPPAAGILGAAYDKPSKRKNFAFACFSAGTPVGFGIGSIIMGVAARVSGWRAGFWVFAVVWAFLTMLSVWVVPGGMETYKVGKEFKGRFGNAMGRFDFWGTFLTVFGVGLVMTGLTLGPSDGWKTGHVIAMIILGFFLLVAFVFWENYCRHPLMPLHIWKDTIFALLIPTTLLGTTSLISSNFWLALFLQEQQHLPPLPVAVRLLPQVISAVLANIVAAIILHRVNNTAIMAFGAAMYVLANTLLAVQRPDAIYWAFIFPSLVTNVLGLDLQFNVANMYIMQSLPSNQQSLAAGIFNMFIRLGTTIGLGISTAVYSSILSQEESKDESERDEFRPYKAAFYVSVALAVMACLFVPFLRIGRQGVSKE